MILWELLVCLDSDIIFNFVLFCLFHILILLPSLVYTMLTLNEIINGQGEGGFPGLIPIIQVFLDTTSMGNDVRDVVEEVPSFSPSFSPPFFPLSTSLILRSLHPSLFFCSTCY